MSITREIKFLGSVFSTECGKYDNNKVLIGDITVDKEDDTEVIVEEDNGTVIEVETTSNTQVVTAKTIGNIMADKKDETEVIIEEDNGTVIEVETTSNTQDVTAKTQGRKYTQTRIPVEYTKNADSASIPWGDIPTLKNDDSCRIIMQNVNGLGGSYNSKSIALAAEADAICGDIIGLIETNTHWQFGDIKATTKKSWQKYFDQTKIATSSSDVHFDSQYQPGGTMMVVGSPWASRTKTSSDESGLGRWTEAEIMGKNNTAVSVITVYAVGKNKIGTCGPQTNYFQQWNVLNSKNQSCMIDPRERLFTDLSKVVLEKQKDGKEVIVLIDANDTLQKPNSKLTNWTKETNLMDIHLELHGTKMSHRHTQEDRIELITF